MLIKIFNTYGENDKNEISDSNNKIDAKQDISLILFKALSNLLNIHHYDDIDGYHDERDEQAKKLHKGIIWFHSTISWF